MCQVHPLGISYDVQIHEQHGPYIPQFHSQDLRDSDVNLRPPLMATNRGQQSFSYRGAAVWNSLGKGLKAACLLQSFKYNIQHL